jgi:outer membrane immunogenic protein
MKMKKLVLALSALAAFTGSALAADLPARTYTKAPEMAPVASWTGFYIGGGGGGGLWAADSNVVASPLGTVLTRDQRLGGSGLFGTVGAGYDWQLNSSWVLGILADGQFGSIRGSLTDPTLGVAGFEGTEKLQTSYAAGVRLGYLVAPNVLSYVNAGYSGSEWSGTTATPLSGGGISGTTPSFHRDGFFVGGGVENNLNIFGITAPGWFMKTEYRSAFYDRISLPESFITGAPVGNSVTFKPWVQTISTSLVYRFNWSGTPVVSRY